jgi:hypothetical protein
MVRWAGHEARIGTYVKCIYSKSVVGEPEGRRQSEDVRIDLRIILKWVLKMPHDRGQ